MWEELWRSLSPGLRCVEKGETWAAKEGFRSTNTGWWGNVGSFDSSPLSCRGSELLKSNLLKQPRCRFLGAAAERVPDPGVAELCWWAERCAPVLTPGACASGVCPDSSCSVLVELCSFFLCYPPSAPSGVCASSLSPIVRNFFPTVWAGDRF